MNANAERWCSELESGTRRQGATYLKRQLPGEEAPGYCCLGVACEMAAEEGIVAEVSFAGGESEGLVFGYAAPGSSAPRDASETAYLPDEVRGWLGLADVHGTYAGERSLARDNDGDASFAEIAATIRSEPEGLFA